MRQSGDELRQFGVISPQVVAERVIPFLRRMYPRATAEMVARDTGLSPKTVSKWLERSSAPSGAALVQLANTYRMAFLIALLPGSEWVEIGANAVERAALADQVARSDRRLAALAARRRAAR
jgi:transcriptional regulator with XRE-family HTH domain